jgi:hypothetical protein
MFIFGSCPLHIYSCILYLPCLFPTHVYWQLYSASVLRFESDIQVYCFLETTTSDLHAIRAASHEAIKLCHSALLPYLLSPHFQYLNNSLKTNHIQVFVCTGTRHINMNNKIHCPSSQISYISLTINIKDGITLATFTILFKKPNIPFQSIP